MRDRDTQQYDRPSLSNQLLYCIHCWYHVFLVRLLVGWGGGGLKQTIFGHVIIFGCRKIRPAGQTDNSVPQKNSQQCGLRPHLQSHSLHWPPYSPCWQSPACLTPSLASPHPRFHDWLRLIPLQQKVIINQDAGAWQESFREPHTA